MTTRIGGKLQNLRVDEGVADAADIDFMESDGTTTNLQNDITALKANSGGGSVALPYTNRVWGQHIIVDTSGTAGVSNPDIIFDTDTVGEQPFSIDYFSGTNAVTDDITNSSNGISNGYLLRC